MIVITATSTGVVTGIGQDVDVVVGSIVTNKGVTGNDDDGKAAPTASGTLYREIVQMGGGHER